MANVSFTLQPPSLVANTDRSDIPAEEVDGAERQQRSSVRAATGFPGRIQPGVSILSVLESEVVGKQAGQGSSSAASLELISNFWNGIKRSKVDKPPEKKESSGRRLSTEEIMRMAGMRFIQSQDRRNDYISGITQRFGSDLSGLSQEDLEEVDLAQLLLAAAEKVGENELDRASRLLSYCEVLSSKGRSTAKSPAKKVVLLFVDALRERINIARGEHDSKRLVMRNNQYLRTSAMQLNCYRILPFIQIAQFSAIQVLVEHTATASRIHIVDLAIRSGVHVIILMQALLDRKEKPIELLKISAIATHDMDMVEETGKRLVNVAKSMGLNFSFRVIPVQHVDDVREEMFDIEDGEAVAVYSPLVFKALISRQKSLENLMTVLRSLNSSVMVMTEIQANHNSPSFVARFIEGLFFYSAFMDCLDTCLARDGENDMVSEKCLFSGVTNMLSTEGKERTIRNVKIEVWRAFFTRQGMVEVGLSESSLCHGRLVAQQFPYPSFSTLEHDGKCLIIGWRGTPFLSVSAWKFR